jgi:S1-C subfamily serine protease
VLAENLPSIPVGDSRQLEVGDFVLAIGYPANIGQSVTSGIVSGLHRTNVGIEQFENFIQTDAAIYPGNSGGALVDLQGDVVGINTAFIGATSTNPGMGFAIPVNMARIIADQIVEFGDVRRGSLGVTIDEPTPDVIREVKIAAPPTGGAVVVKVAPGSSGARAGLKVGDVVTEIANRPVTNAGFLRNRLALLRVGEAADLTVLRDGKPLKVQAMRPRQIAPAHVVRARSPSMLAATESFESVKPEAAISWTAWRTRSAPSLAATQAATASAPLPDAVISAAIRRIASPMVSRARSSASRSK